MLLDVGPKTIFMFSAHPMDDAFSTSNIMGILDHRPILWSFSDERERLA